MTLKLNKFDVQNYLKTPEEQAAYLEAAQMDGDLSFLATALGDIAKARGAAAFARESGIQRQTIYKQFREGGDPRLSTLSKAMSALGIEMHFTAAPKA